MNSFNIEQRPLKLWTDKKRQRIKDASGIERIKIFYATQTGTAKVWPAINKINEWLTSMLNGVDNFSTLMFAQTRKITNYNFELNRDSLE